MELSEGLVLRLLQSDQEFPIDFDDAWVWLGYSRKDAAKRKFLSCDFTFDTDYTLHISVERVKGGRGGGSISKEKIYITVECLKIWGMMAETSKGKEVRNHFLDCEKELRRRISDEQQKSRQRIVKVLVSHDFTQWQKRFEDQFFDEAYRVTGWRKSRSGHPPCMGRFIRNNIYEHFPEGTVEELERVNPKVNTGRKRKHHQHLKQLGVNILDSQTSAVLAVMRLSPDNDKKRFKQNMEKALGYTIQLELPFLDDVL